MVAHANDRGNDSPGPNKGLSAADVFLDGDEPGGRINGHDVLEVTDFPGVSPEHVSRHLKVISPEVALRTVRTRGAVLDFTYHRPDGTSFTVSRMPDGYDGPRYLCAAEQRGLTVHPLVRDRLNNPDIPLVFVEGTKQYLSAVTVLRDEPLCPVGINGIRGWQYKKDGPGTLSGPLPDFRYIPLVGRKVYLVPDGDYATKDGVREGADGFMSWLASQGADTARVTVPLADGQGSTGLDDYFERTAPEKCTQEFLRLISEARAGQLPEFLKEVSPDVREGVRNTLLGREVVRLANQYEASQRAESSMTVAEALDAVLNGAVVDVPTVALIDGHERGWGLIYPGHVNGIYGDMSVAKTVIMTEIQARTLNEGGIVAHWEFDNNSLMTIVKRLLDAGADRESIRGRFHVLYSASGRDALTDDVKRAVKLVTLDALNPAVVAFGLDPYHPGGADTVIQECFKHFTLHGACGLFIDHVGHDNKERQAGSIRKAQAIQGALYEAKMDTPLKPGTTGRTKLVLRKDNRGALGDMTGRAVAVAVMESKADTGDLAGEVVTRFELCDGQRVKSDDYIDTSVPEGTSIKDQIWTVLWRVYQEQTFTRNEAKSIMAKEGVIEKTFLNKFGELRKEALVIGESASRFRMRAYFREPLGTLPGDPTVADVIAMRATSGPAGDPQTVNKSS